MSADFFELMKDIWHAAKPVPARAREAWVKALSPANEVEICAAVFELAKELKFSPSVAEIYGKVLELRIEAQELPDFEEEWLKLSAEFAKSGGPASPVFSKGEFKENRKPLPEFSPAFTSALKACGKPPRGVEAQNAFKDRLRELYDVEIRAYVMGEPRKTKRKP